MEERFEDQGHVLVTLQVIRRLQTPVGQNEDVFGLEASARQRRPGDRQVGAGAVSPAVCQSTPRKSRASSSISRPARRFWWNVSLPAS